MKCWISNWFTISTIIFLISFIIILTGCSDKEPSSLERIFFGGNGETDYSLYQPMSPVPADQAINQEIYLQLSWQCFNPSDDSLGYDIYFATTANPSIVGSNISENAYDPGELQGNTIYYWKIVSKASSGDMNTGPVWQFTTKSIPNRPPDQPSSPFPVENAQSPSLNIRLSWECSDPDGDSLEYDVYLGPNPNPTLASSQQSTNYYDTGRLSNNSTYYWYIIAYDVDGLSTSGPPWNFDVDYGGKIAFTSPRENYNYEIYIMDVDGTNQENISNNSGTNLHPSWSPNGTKIAYSYYSILYLMDADGTNQERLNDLNTYDDYSPCWSPDGSQITYSSTDDIWIIDATGNNSENVTLSGLDEWNPSWSPDGLSIIYVKNRNGYAEIYEMNTDGSNQTPLTSNSAHDSYPDWSPDGTKIAFASNRDGNYEIYTMSSNGSNQVRLTDNSATDRSPSWSPNGTKIAFISDRDGNYEVYVMDADGSNQYNISNTADYDEYHPDWGYPPY